MPTDRQLEVLAAIREHGGLRAAARALNVAKSTVDNVVKAVGREELEARGIHIRPGMSVRFTHTIYDGNGEVTRTTVGEAPDSGFDEGGLNAGDARDGTGPYVIKGVSTLYDASGQQRAQWVKTRLDTERFNAGLRAAAAAMAETLPRVEPVAAPEATLADLCATYTLTDAHIGMLAWRREGGADWDLRIAEQVIVGCFADAIKANPATETAILNQLGDLLHYDSLSAVTPTSGHLLDADGRFTKMVEVAVRVLRRIVAMMLEKHQRVHLVLAEGNHDMASSVWLRTMFKALYENEPRITVDDSALPYYLHEFGDVMQVFHHSHLTKFETIGAKVPALFPEAWGRTKFRYVHTGNLHHKREKDENGIEVIQHPTVAARDAYAARGAWFANRAMLVIVYHRDRGEVWRQTFRPGAFEAAA
jgi:hypothetical protein